MLVKAINNRRDIYESDDNAYSIDNGKSELVSKQSKISDKLSSYQLYVPKFKDYMYTVSKSIR